ITGHSRLAIAAAQSDRADVAGSNVVERIDCCHGENERIARGSAGGGIDLEVSGTAADSDLAASTGNSVDGRVVGRDRLVADRIKCGAEAANSSHQTGVCREDGFGVAADEMDGAGVA